jgi:hypothetical protein
LPPGHRAKQIRFTSSCIHWHNQSQIAFDRAVPATFGLKAAPVPEFRLASIKRSAMRTAVVHKLALVRAARPAAFAQSVIRLYASHLELKETPSSRRRPGSSRLEHSEKYTTPDQDQ